MMSREDPLMIEALQAILRTANDFTLSHRDAREDMANFALNALEPLDEYEQEDVWTAPEEAEVVTGRRILPPGISGVGISAEHIHIFSGSVPMRADFAEDYHIGMREGDVQTLD